MKNIENCTTMESTPFKDMKEITSASTITNSNHKKKSLTVYSSLKNVDNQLNSFGLQNDQMQKPKKHLVLTQSKNKLQRTGRSQSTKEMPETGEGTLKMNLCGLKSCEVNLENSYKFFDQQRAQNQDHHRKKNRVVYERKKQTSQLSETFNNNPIDMKVNDFIRHKLNGKQNKVKNLSNLINCGTSLTNRQKNDENSHVQNEVQKSIKNSMLLGYEISDISQKNEAIQFSKQENSKKDSFSVSYSNTSRAYFYSDSIPKFGQNSSNFDKLKQIYQNESKSELPFEQSRVTMFDPEKFQTERTKNLIDQRLGMDFRKINKNQDSNNLQGPRDSARTIIGILDD